MWVNLIAMTPRLPIIPPRLSQWTCLLLGWSLLFSGSALCTQVSSFHDVYDLIDTVAHDGLAPDALIQPFVSHGIALVAFEGVPWSRDTTDVVLLDGTHLPSMNHWLGNGIVPPNFMTFVDTNTCVSAWALAGHYGLHDTPVFVTAPTPPANPSVLPSAHPKSLQSMSGPVDKLVLRIMYWTPDDAPRSDACVHQLTLDEPK